MSRTAVNWEGKLVPNYSAWNGYGSGAGPTPPPPVLSRNLIVSFLIEPSNGVWSISSIFADGMVYSGPQAGSIPNPNLAFNNGQIPGYLEALQAQGYKILLSIGGAVFDVATSFPDVPTSQAIALGICGAVLGNNSISTDWLNPLAPFTFDGLDIDFEQASAVDVSTVTSFLNTLRANIPAGKVITGAPQSPYMFNSSIPSSWNANANSMPYTGADKALTTLNTTSTDALLSVTNVGKMDYLLYQYYNQDPPGTPLLYPPGTLFPNVLAQCAFLCRAATSTVKPKVVIGLLSDTNFPSAGYSPNPVPSAAVFAGQLWQGIQDAQIILEESIPGIQITDWLHGLASWQSPYAQSYLSSIIALQPGIPNNVFLYGGQTYVGNGYPPYGSTNPGW